jgi:hypothetical protein
VGQHAPGEKLGLTFWPSRAQVSFRPPRSTDTKVSAAPPVTLNPQIHHERPPLLHRAACNPKYPNSSRAPTTQSSPLSLHHERPPLLRITWRRRTVLPPCSCLSSPHHLTCSLSPAAAVSDGRRPSPTVGGGTLLPAATPKPVRSLPFPIRRAQACGDFRLL